MNLTRRTRKIDGQRTVHEVFIGDELLIHAMNVAPSEFDISWALNARARPYQPVKDAWEAKRGPKAKGIVVVDRDEDE